MTDILLALIAGLLFWHVVNEMTSNESDTFVQVYMSIGLALLSIVAGVIVWGIAYGLHSLLGFLGLA